ncbi:RNA pseudouridine synthase, partial [Leptolyngbya sp. FACHB-36]|uniref:pseudouridine synthase n=1 Tax=Leptolyngbya sp. FACHB-36 TaxID=2692808 RepID=UPI001680D897
VEQSIGPRSHPILGHLYMATPDGLPAYSECQVLRRNAATSLLDVRILTGRPHQIRIHLAAAGYPLVGDPLYTIGGQAIALTPSDTGEMPVPGDCGYHLHAMHLQVAHPNGQPLSFTCPPPIELSV